MARLAVIGGGVAGLAAARVAARAGWSVTLLEASSRLGGKVRTEMVDGVPWEWGPDAIVASKPRGADLLEELGLEAVGLATGRAYLLARGELLPIPPGTAMGIPKGPSALMAAARAGILTRGEALRGAAEPLMPRGHRGGFEEVARRRFGWGVAERLTLPLVTAVFGTPDPDFAMALPDLAGARSLMRGARRRPPVRFLGIPGGMERLIEALAAELGDVEVRTGTRAEALEGSARPLLPSLPEGFGDFTSSAVIHLRYPEGALERPLDAAGYVSSDPDLVQACSWVSAKWPHPGERGPHLRAVVVDPGPAPDVELGQRVAEEVGRVMEARTAPETIRVRRWTHALPRYRAGHAEAVLRLREALPPSIQVAGASYDGVGVPDCVASGEAAAERILALWEVSADRSG